MQTGGLAPGMTSLGSSAITLCSWAASVAAMLRGDERNAGSVVSVAHPLICLVARGPKTVIVAPVRAWIRARPIFRTYEARLSQGQAMLLLVGAADNGALESAMEAGLIAVLPDGATSSQMHVSLRSAFELMNAHARAQSRGKWLNRYRYELGELIETARAIENERDIDKLLELILSKSRSITGADAGSIYVLETDSATGQQQLRFKLCQNDSVAFDAREFTIPLSTRSMAGASVVFREPICIDDVYDLPEDSPCGFDRSFDQKTGYRTKSVFCIPLVARSNEIIGVIQLINKKRDPQKHLQSKGDIESEVIAFDQRSQELLSTLASQAGISLENAMLLEEIRLIFEGFVRASVEAIEQRDPTTSGHSRRVSHLTVELAKAVERVDTGPYREVNWTAEDLREIEYASLLHDFGKIGVREQVLVKAKKLQHTELDLVRQRLELASRSHEVEMLSRKLRAMERGASARELAALDAELQERLAEVEKAWRVIVRANEPTVVRSGDFGELEKLARHTFMGPCGEPRPLLTSAEVMSLSVMRGSLTVPEIDEIRSHVTHTFNFLSTIPWGKSFRRVPFIAGAHHERLNGTGYPKRLRGEEIPLQSRLLSISDIFDALTATDRPYKRAVTLETALDILSQEVRDQHLDGELVRIFFEARIWESLYRQSAG